MRRRNCARHGDAASALRQGVRGALSARSTRRLNVIQLLSGRAFASPGASKYFASLQKGERRETLYSLSRPGWSNSQPDQLRETQSVRGGIARHGNHPRAAWNNLETSQQLARL